jgi:Ca-activated chloride channel family protein
VDLKASLGWHFLYPAWLWILPAVWLLAAWCAWRGRQDGGWSAVIDPAMLSALRLGSAGHGHSPWFLLALAWSLAVLALAGPAWQREQRPAFKMPPDWIVLLDLSPSMAARDLKPDRATRARYGIEDLLRAARDARVSLVVFAGEAHTVAPLTTDVATVRALLQPLAPDIMPETGDAIAPALLEAARMLRSASSRHADVIVLTDGFSDPARGLQAAQDLRRQGATVFVVGVGTAAGAPEPDGKGNFLHDARGRTALARLPVDELRRVAAAGAGRYLPLNELGNLIASLQDEHSRRIEGPDTKVIAKVSTWRNGGVWLLPPLLLLIAPLARRGWL